MFSLNKMKSEIENIIYSVKLDDIISLTNLISSKILLNKSVFFCGNGGSGATANLFAFKLIQIEKVRAKAYSLNNNIASITGSSDKFNYAQSFNQQLESLGREGDLLIAISGSGNSPNIINVVKAAKQLGINTFGLTGMGGGELAELVDQSIIVESYSMQQIENLHSVIVSSILKLMEKHHEQLLNENNTISVLSSN